MMRASNAATILLALAGLSPAGCARPGMQFEGLAVSAVKQESIDLLATYKLYNPYPWEITVEEVRWHVQGGCRPEPLVPERTILRPMRIAPKHCVQIPLSGELLFLDLAKAGLAEHKRFDYVLCGEVKLSTPCGPMSIGFADNGCLPVFHPVEVCLRGVAVTGTMPTRVVVELVLEIHNPNEIWLRPAMLEGSLLIDGRPLAALRTDMSHLEPICPGSRIEVRLAESIFSPEVGVRRLEELIKNPAARFGLDGTITFRLPGTGDVRELLQGTPDMNVRSQTPQ